MTTSISQQWEALDNHGEMEVGNAMQAIQTRCATIFDAMSPKSKAERASSSLSWEQETLASQPGPDYEGPDVTFPLDGPQVDRLALFFAEHPLCTDCLHPSYMCRILLDALVLLATLPRVPWVRSDAATETGKLIVVGDLHGQLQDLLTIFIENGFPGPTGPQYLFNGDLVDRGEMGVELVTLVLAYKIVYPDCVHINRGNHESVYMNMAYGFMDEVTEKFGGTQMFTLFTRVWNLLPLATVIDDFAFVVHGGLFRTRGITLAQLESVPRKDCEVAEGQPLEMQLLTDALWSDPVENCGSLEGVRGGGTIEFGTDVTASFLKRNGLGLVIRSHQVPSNNRGYEVLHDGKLVTVFSASNYCESKGNHGGLVVFDAPGRYTLKEFWAPFLFEVAELLEANLPDRLPGKACAHQRPSISAPLQQAEVDRRGLEEVRASLRGMIAKRVDGLERFYRGCPQIERNCVVSLADWTAGLRSVLQVDLNFEAHREALAGPDADGPVDWRRFLDQYRVEVGDAAAGWNEGLQADIRDRLLGLDLTVSEYFQLFDTNNDGQIDLEEMQAALPALGLSVASGVLGEMMERMGPGNGTVDVLAFLESLHPTYSGPPLAPQVQEVIAAMECLLASSSKSLLSLFRQLDRDDNGKLDLGEICHFMEWLSAQRPEYAGFASDGRARQLFEAFDLNNSGSISLVEFLECFKPSAEGVMSSVDRLVQQISRSIYNYQGSLKYLFYLMDNNGDGRLSCDELRDGLRTIQGLQCSSLTDAEIELVARYADTDADGYISWQEFLNAFGVQVDGKSDKSASRSSGGPGSPQYVAWAGHEQQGTLADATENCETEDGG